MGGMTKNITINTPEHIDSIDGIQIEQTITQPEDLELGHVKVGDATALTYSNLAVVIILLGSLVLFRRLTK